MSWMYGSALESANFGNCVFKVLQSSNVFFLFHSVLEFPGKWIGKIQKRVSIIFWFFGLVHKHSLQTSLHNLLHVFFSRMNETTVVLKRRLQFYMKGFFRGDLYIWSTSILYFFFVFICLLIIHYRREYPRYGSDTKGFASSNLKRKLWPLDYKYLNVWVWPLDCSYLVWSLKGRRQSL